MSYVVLLGLIVLIGLMNLMTGLLQWLVSPYGLVSVFILGNLSLCALTASCPPAALMRRLCARAGCTFG
jgi:hypothetical protein